MRKFKVFTDKPSEEIEEHAASEELIKAVKTALETSKQIIDFGFLIKAYCAFYKKASVLLFIKGQQRKMAQELILKLSN
jgi:hypothetical protein